MDRTCYDIEHISRYLYAWPISNSVMSLRLMPRHDSAQRLFDFEITTDPPSAINMEKDCFGNSKHVINIHRSHDSLEVTARSSVQASPAPTLPDSLGLGAWEEIRSWRESFDEWDFIHSSEFARPSQALTAFVDRQGIANPGADPLVALLDLSDTLHRAFEYVPGSTSVVSPIEDILGSGRGVCQDYAHVMIAVARLWGIPARYVSGYLHIVDREGRPVRAQASHAWVECRLPDLGWIGFDPTNRSIAGERHVRVAVGRDYRDVAPTHGVFRGGGSTRLEVEVAVEPGVPAGWPNGTSAARPACARSG